MRSNFHQVGQKGSPWLRYCFFILALGALLSAACDNGCKSDSDVETLRGEVEAEEAEPLSEQVVAVARLLRFNERHFDLRHWRTLAIDEGILQARDDRSHGIAEMPTAQFRVFVEEILGDEARRIHWDGHLDVVIWRPRSDGESWRWAVSLPRGDGEALSERVDWRLAGTFAVSDEDDAESVPVYGRTWTGNPEASYFVSENDTAIAEGGQYRGRSITISNFAEGAARVHESVVMTGASGRREVELYVWLRRWGIADRYRHVAEVMEQQIAMNAHDLLPARVSLLQLQTQIYRALGNPNSWPEVARLSFHTDRGGDAGAARRAELNIDIPTNEGRMLSALWSSLRQSNLRAGPEVRGDVGQLGMILQPRELTTFAGAVLPEEWLQLMSVRGAGTRQMLIDDFDSTLLHNRGPTTVAFFQGGRDLTGEVFVGWRVMDREMMPEVLQRFLTRFMRDYWMPLFDVNQFARRGARQEEFGGEEVTVYEMTFALPDTAEEAGVCWLIRGSEFLSYFGVDPCRRLREAADGPEVQTAGPAVLYSGSLQALVDKFFVLPGDNMGDLLEGIDIRLRGQRHSHGRLGLTMNLTDLGEIARLVDELPRLQRYWAPGVLFDPELIIMELSLQQSTYQEPGLAAMGAPGMGGVLPTSFLLGMPFSFAPTSPSLFMQVYFENPEEVGESLRRD